MPLLGATVKKTLAALLLLISTTSQAQIPFDQACFVWLHQNDGKIKKNAVPRQSHVRISKDINAAFQAKYFDGSEPVEAAFVIEDAHTKQREVFFSTINEKWSWKFDFQTPYGVAHVECE